MIRVINKNYVTSSLLIAIVEMTADKLGIDIPSIDDLAGYKDKQDDRYLMFKQIKEHMKDEHFSHVRYAFVELEIKDPSDLMELYIAHYKYT